MVPVQLVSGAIPDTIGQLTNLTGLFLHFNKLIVIREEAARALQRLHDLGINLGGNPWRNPPGNVVRRGFTAIVDFWEAIARSGAIVSWKLKVVLVGAVRAGKTSLVNGMIHGEPHLCHEDDRTKGVDVHLSEPCKPDDARKLELVFWDFAGHSEYYPTHQAFLSKGALYLLVLDLKRFTGDLSVRGELVNVWLDALQCRVPGSSVLVVATQIDRCTGDLETKLGDLQDRIESHLSAQRDNLKRLKRDRDRLIFLGVETVSSANFGSLMDLRLKLFKLVHSKQNMFPSLGLVRPVSWVRVSVMLDAMRSGKDPILEASRVGTVEQDQRNVEMVTSGVKFLHRTGAVEGWCKVIRTLKLENEVGSASWNIKGGDAKPSGKNVVFEDAVDGLVREGTILDSGEVLYLEPTWINDLLRAILDHDLTDIMKEDFWKEELKAFSRTDRKVYFHLKNIHDNFSSTGILTVRYLRYLWRDVPEISDRTLFQSLLDTMSRCGVIFQGNPFETGREHAVNGPDDSAGLFVPLHLPSKMLISDLKDLGPLLKGQFRKEMVYEIDQTYVPLGLLGLLMARFLRCEGVEFHKCWGRGTAFTLGEVLVLLHLDSPSRANEEARITVNVFGERFVSEVNKAMGTIEHKIKKMFNEYFGGLYLGRKQGYPRIFDGTIRDTGGYAAEDRRDIDDITSASDKIINAVIARIDGLQAHLDQEMSLLLQVLDGLEDKLKDVAESCHTTLGRLNNLQLSQLPCPKLVIVRPAAATVSVGKKRSLKAMVVGIGRRAKKLVRKDMRLCFLCPYDFSEVPCGLDGNGYPFTANREWVTAILPALKVTAVLAKVAIKAASGVDLPVSDFLNGAKSYIGEEFADSVLDDSVIERVLDGTSGPEEGQVKTLVGEAYEELKKFIEKQKSKGTGYYVHFDKLMQPIDDGEGGKVWVSNDNVELWKKACARKGRP